MQYGIMDSVYRIHQKCNYIRKLILKEVGAIKKNGTILPLSDIVSVGVYKFDEYEILTVGKDKNGLHENRILVGHSRGQQPFEKRKEIIDGMELCTTGPIEPTGTDIVSDRKIFDSLLVLASKVFPALPKKSEKLILSWCEEYGLPFCSGEASKQVGYLACPLHQFRYFLNRLRDTFWKVESMCDEDTDSLIEYGVDNSIFEENPYRRRDCLSKYFTEDAKKSLITDFINEANLNLCFEYRDGVPTFYNYAEDIVSLAKYQFAIILMSSSERVPRHCKCCGSMFFAYRKNQLYCPYCNRQKYYAKQKRQREKEERENGKKE